MKRHLLILAGLLATLLFLQRPHSWLFDPDEARYAEIPQSMILSGDYLTPQLNGAHYFEKPPLLYWLNAGFMAMAGFNSYAARLTTRLASLGIALLLWIFLRRRDSLENRWAAVIYLSAWLPWILGRLNLTDTLVAFGITLTLLSIRAAARSTDGSESRRLIFIAWIGAVISMMSKGLIGIVLPGLIVVIWCGLMNEMAFLKKIIGSWGVVAFLSLTAPWFIYMEVHHPGFLHIFFIREHLLRYTTDEAHRPGSFVYFIPVFILGCLPWTFYFFEFLLHTLRKLDSGWRRYRDELFFSVWFFTVFIFFSISHSKLIPYLLPVFPAAAALIGRQISEKHENKKTIALAYGWGLFLLGLVWATPVAATYYSHHDLAVRAAEIPSDLVVGFRCFPHSFPYVLRKPLPVVEVQDELATDGERDPQLFWTYQYFKERWNSSDRMVVVLRRNQQNELEHMGKKAFLVAGNRKYLLMTNFQ